MPEALNVLFLAAEAEPFVKIGGLGDVAGSLPRYLRNLDPDILGETTLDVRLVLPLHPILRTDRLGLRPLLMFALSHAGEDIRVQVFSMTHEGLPVYFLDARPISQSGSVYSSDSALDAGKYTFFPLAALELTKHLDWRADIVHANDWHASLACYALLLKRRQGESALTAAVLTVHNLQYMGPDILDELNAYGLLRVQTGLPEWASRKPLPLGIWGADAIVAVSPSYAQEIQTPAFGCGLEDYLHARRESLHGILNGIDDQSYNPALDPAIGANFGIPTIERRSLNKTALQLRLGLPEDPDVPLLAMVSRMDPQKGVDLVPPALKRVRDFKWQMVILGTGLSRLEKTAQAFQREFQDRVRVEIRFDEGLARQIYAGADILLMPSRYEPCGLSQLIAMRYGCVPIVTAVGGLRDTVFENVTGFVVSAATAARLATVIKRALVAFGDKARWRAMQTAGMAQDFSWASSARAYFQLYQRLVAQTRPGKLGPG